MLLILRKIEQFYRRETPSVQPLVINSHQAFKYDTRLGGYRLNITEAQLKSAPKYSGESWDWEDRTRGRKVYDYYGATWRNY